MSKMSRAELVALLDEITAILETQASAAEKLESIEALMFDPSDATTESDDEEED